jgi:putative transposase
VRYAFIEQQRGSYPLGMLCQVLEVSRSGYADWIARGKSSPTTEDERLAAKIRVVHGQSRGTYGSPRVTQALRTQGESVNEKRVARIMRERAIAGRAKRKYRATTDSAHSLPVAENLLDRQFSAAAPNRVWVSDITAIATREGWWYLAVIIDLCTRQVVGFAQAAHMRAELVKEAFLMAYWRHKPVRGLLFHSDRGSQYAAHAFRRLLAGLGMVQSMSRKGNCWDNAVAESFFHSLKVEAVQGRTYDTRRQAQAAISDYILGFFNPLRLHSALGYRTPNDHARQLGKAA